MSILKQRWLLALAILLYVMVHSSSLLTAWMETIGERYAPFFWLIWVLPVVISWVLPLFDVEDKTFFSTPLLSLAIFSTFFGVVASFNTFKYCGFAVTLAAWTPYRWYTFPWLVTALAWMPLMGWFGVRYLPDYYLFFRGILVMSGTLFWVFCACQENKGVFYEQ